jgi:hypothetical protein
VGFLRDIQLEHPYVLSRWLLSEPAGSSLVFDDVGGVILLRSGSPTLGEPTLCKGDVSTCCRGGYSTQQDYLQATVTAFALTAGVSLEGVTARDPNGVSFSLVDAPGQAQILVAGADVQFSVWTTSQSMLTASSVMSGWPQHVVGTYDPVAQLQELYVDGALVAKQMLVGAVAAATTGNTVLLQPTSSSSCVALGQDVAVYGGALQPSRVAQHFAAFAQVWPDPGHVVSYTPIGVTQ